MLERIKDRLARDELILAAGVGRIGHRNLLQIIGIQGGFHAVWFDHEHVGLSIDELEVGTMACRSQGLDCFVRIAPTDYALVTRCLEAGGGGVMAAQISSAEQAERFVRWSKFHPRGSRGLNAGGWDAQFATMPIAEFCETANRETFVAIQIETLPAVEQCADIAAIDEALRTHGSYLIYLEKPGDPSQMIPAATSVGEATAADASGGDGASERRNW